MVRAAARAESAPHLVCSRHRRPGNGILSIPDGALSDLELDPTKSAANKAKHGIDFVEAQAIWNDPDRLARIAMKKQSVSSRSAAHGRAKDKSTSARGRRTTVIPAGKLDELFDSGSDEIDKHLDWEKARRPAREVQRVNVDFPVDLLDA